jgi:hypothetical protein
LAIKLEGNEASNNVTFHMSDWLTHQIHEAKLVLEKTNSRWDTPEISIFYSIWRFIPMFTKVHRQNVSWVRWIQPTFACRNFNIIFPSMPRPYAFRFLDWYI